ncbi:hypothetical protein C7444_11151 [Sphaerotilus hippei]|uniref:Uncharacterized protein n=1 Tax=Sphaerotilus hippei TaxID=744406 RepID=A0A318GZ97_9BURK|nr:hypothetical protein [Sphaerotilus hippei]PXW94968.1 hypothetical protein C7444_11151 [Sphaerotilus hippei]
MVAIVVDFAMHADIEHIGFELGWDHARHSVEPAAACMGLVHPVRQGYEAGRASFGPRARAATPGARQWLALRLQAWLRGRSFDLMSVTPNYLQQLHGSHCPVTRAALTEGRLQPPHGAATDAVISRICDDAGYAAGNLAQISLAAEVAKADLSADEAFAQADRLLASGLPQLDGLGADAWRRLAVLMSFVTPLPHEQAARLPLLVMPSNRLRLLNPIQAVQVLMTQQLARPDCDRRIDRLVALLPDSDLQQDLQRFFAALQPLVAEAVRTTDGLPQRWRLEDAWRHPDVLHHWQHFALQLDATQAEALLVRAAALGLSAQRVMVHSAEQATEGWQLETRGFMPEPVRPRVPVVAGRRSGMATVLDLVSRQAHRPAFSPRHTS